jgi:hypothetical protein
MPAQGSGTNKGGQIETERLGFSVSGRPREAKNAFSKIGGFVPYLSTMFPERPGPPIRFNLAPDASATPMCKHMY